MIQFFFVLENNLSSTLLHREDVRKLVFFLSYRKYNI